jgi:hypothetical protein
MRLYYYSHTPIDYEPIFFKSGQDSCKKGDGLDLHMGSIQTNHHELSLQVFTKCPIVEEEEDQGLETFVPFSQEMRFDSQKSIVDNRHMTISNSTNMAVGPMTVSNTCNVNTNRNTTRMDNEYNSSIGMDTIEKVVPVSRLDYNTSTIGMNTLHLHDAENQSIGLDGIQSSMGIQSTQEMIDSNQILSQTNTNIPVQVELENAVKSSVEKDVEDVGKVDCICGSIKVVLFNNRITMTWYNVHNAILILIYFVMVINPFMMILYRLYSNVLNVNHFP